MRFKENENGPICPKDGLTRGTTLLRGAAAASKRCKARYARRGTFFLPPPPSRATFRSFFPAAFQPVDRLSFSGNAGAYSSRSWGLVK